MRWMEKQALGYVIQFIRAIRGSSTKCPSGFPNDRQHSGSCDPTVVDAIRLFASNRPALYLAEVAPAFGAVAEEST
jgi:hypothetical protein